MDNVTTKLSKTVGLIAKLKHFVPQHTSLNIYRALILPYFSLWFDSLGTLGVKNTFNKIKLKSYCFRKTNREVHAISLFIDANILPINSVSI